MTNKTDAPSAAEKLEHMANIETSALFSQRQALKNGAATIRTQADRIAQLEAEKVHLLDALKDIASGEILRSHCTGPHCVEELGVATADELSSRAAGALDWDTQTAGTTDARAQLAQRQVPADGWVMAPREPTKEMIAAGIGQGRAATVYACMLAASPTPPRREVRYRLLARGEPMQKGDEHINDDTETWTPIRNVLVTAGAKWSPAYQPMRRRLATPTE